jgi:hypothetical protein
MIQAKTDLKPANWQITAITIHCDCIADDVTIMVDKDWTTRCAWYRRYKHNAPGDRKQKFDKTVKLMIAKCLGPECPLALKYRDRLIQDEFGIK